MQKVRHIFHKDFLKFFDHGPKHAEVLGPGIEPVPQQ